MKDTRIVLTQPGRRSGVALIYTVFMMTALCGFASLAFDYGHVQMCKNQIRRSVDAAARAAASGLNTTPAAAQALALRYADLNQVDGTALVLDPSQGDVQFGTWVIDPTGKTPPHFQLLTGAATSGANAVRVVGHRSSARGTAVALVFAQVLGVRFCDVTAESIAMYVPALNLNQTVQATANPFLSGMPTGSEASVVNPHHTIDYSGTASNAMQSPQAVGMPVSAGQSLNFDAIAGTAGHDPTLPSYEPDGELDNIGHNNLTTSENSEYGSVMFNENGIADMWCPINALVGVFLDDKAPNATAAPANLDFSSDASRDFTTLQPKLKQLFFIGDGMNSNGTPQQFVAPAGATRFFLATWDFYEWNNNYGYRTVKVSRPAQVITVE